MATNTPLTALEKQLIKRLAADAPGGAPPWNESASRGYTDAFLSSIPDMTAPLIVKGAGSVQFDGRYVRDRWEEDLGRRYRNEANPDVTLRFGNGEWLFAEGADGFSGYGSYGREYETPDGLTFAPVHAAAPAPTVTKES